MRRSLYCIGGPIIHCTLYITILQSCNVAKHLPTGEKLYVGADFVLKTDSTIAKKEKERLVTELQALARPRPNSRIFGFPYKVAFYYFVGEPKKEKGFRAGLRRKFGEAPVLASARGLAANGQLMGNTLENEGYFGTSLQGDFVDVNGYQTKARYTIQVPQRYLIDSVSFIGDSTLVARAMFNASPQSFLKAGNPFVLDVVKAEKERIGSAIKQRGFFYFLPDYVTVLTDTAVGNHRVRFYLAIKPDIPAAAKVPYFLRNIYIFPNYTLATARTDTNRTLAYQAPIPTAADSGKTAPPGKFYIVDSSRVYNPVLFEDVISIRPGRRYNSRAQDLSLSRLVNLGTFKYIRNRFEPVGRYGRDSALMDANYYLTPLPKRSVRLEVSGNSRSNNLAGTLLTASYIDRNFLRRAEQLQVNATAGIDLQIGAAGRGVTNYRYGIDATLSFPRLVSPFKIRYDRRSILPKTNLTVGYEILQRDSLYNLSSARASFGYAFRTSNRVEHSFSPFYVNYVNIYNFEQPKFIAGLLDTLTGPTYARLLKAQFILSALYTFNYNSDPQTRRRYTNRLTINMEPAGNLAGLLIKPDDTGYKNIAGLPFAQFFRFDLDTRHYFQLSPKLTWANRFFGGVGIPYGNSNEMPFIRQYFIGGANSVRAFRPRAAGPGTYTPAKGTLFQDGGGDIKLEVNTELRAKLTSLLQLAAFVDAGNVWSYARVSTYGPGAEFTKDFAKQLAIGGGIGLRIDLSYFLVRADLATPFSIPYLPEGQRWVLNKINFRDRDWRRDNLVLNIAVGYPF
ncbi:BamA/TamA family outer membrane protein [Fibrella sp. HMF5036]|uniref:BamA/TamA family outer membrane protein n=1 Tax=Fibrella aquatilis TaxID=2817059 RepID=A0A939G074_9BACT|nr:BamA/TamA family outer membrane protein [Fibrella aquatilis]